MLENLGMMVVVKLWSSGSEIDNSTVGGGGGGAGEIGYDGNGTDHSINSTNIILGQKITG